MENLGARMVREVASKTSDIAGDGTTTATVLAQAIYREGAKNVTAGASPMAVKRGIDTAVLAITAELAKMSQAGERGAHRVVRRPMTDCTCTIESPALADPALVAPCSRLWTPSLSWQVGIFASDVPECPTR